ncbi:hypothetical protein Nmel_015951, partial [Mimus melanotis]
NQGICTNKTFLFCSACPPKKKKQNIFSFYWTSSHYSDFSFFWNRSGLVSPQFCCQDPKKPLLGLCAGDLALGSQKPFPLFAVGAGNANMGVTRGLFPWMSQTLSVTQGFSFGCHGQGSHTGLFPGI